MKEKFPIEGSHAIILQRFSDKEIIVLDDKMVDCSTSVGVIKIFEYKI